MSVYHKAVPEWVAAHQRIRVRVCKPRPIGRLHTICPKMLGRSLNTCGGVRCSTSGMFIPPNWWAGAFALIG